MASQAVVQALVLLPFCSSTIPRTSEYSAGWDTRHPAYRDRQTEAGRQRQRERVARVRNPEKERVGRERGGGDGGRDDGLGGRRGGWAGRLNPSRCPDAVWGPWCHSGEGTDARLGLPRERGNLLRASDLASQGQSQAAGPRPSQAVPGMVWVVLSGWGGWPQILQLLPGWQTPRVCHRAPNQTSQSWQGGRAYLAAFRGLWARRLGPFKPLPLALPGPAWAPLGPAVSEMGSPHPTPELWGSALAGKGPAHGLHSLVLREQERLFQLGG